MGLGSEPESEVLRVIVVLIFGAELDILGARGSYITAEYLPD